MFMNDKIYELKQLVEKIVDYTRRWSLSETEWYWNVNSVRKSNYRNEERITQREFEQAIREEILYDLVCANCCGLLNQMENDLCNHYETDILFHNESRELEKEVQKLFDFKIERESNK